MHKTFYESNTKIQYVKYCEYFRNTAFWRYGFMHNDPKNFRNSSDSPGSVSYREQEIDDSDEETIEFVEDRLPSDDHSSGEETISFGRCMQLMYGSVLMDRPNKIKDMVSNNLSWFESLPVYRVYYRK